MVDTHALFVREAQKELQRKAEVSGIPDKFTLREIFDAARPLPPVYKEPADWVVQVFCKSTRYMGTLQDIRKFTWLVETLVFMC